MNSLPSCLCTDVICAKEGHQLRDRARKCQVQSLASPAKGSQVEGVVKDSSLRNPGESLPVSVDKTVLNEPTVRSRVKRLPGCGRERVSCTDRLHGWIPRQTHL